MMARDETWGTIVVGSKQIKPGDIGNRYALVSTITFYELLILFLVLANEIKKIECE